MQITADRLEQIQTVIMQDDEGFSFYVKGKEANKDISWYITNRDKIFEAGPKNEEGDHEFFDEIDGFLEKVRDKDLIAYLFNSETREYYTKDEWEDLAKELGITELVVISTKVPRTIARRFEYFAERSGTKSEELRNLVINYVKEKVIENVDRLIFKDQI